MFKFECPFCNTKEYSAYESPEHQHVTCIVCGAKYDNPYYQPDFGRRKEDR